MSEIRNVRNFWQLVYFRSLTRCCISRGTCPTAWSTSGTFRPFSVTWIPSVDPKIVADSILEITIVITYDEKELDDLRKMTIVFFQLIDEYDYCLLFLTIVFQLFNKYDYFCCFKLFIWLLFFNLLMNMTIVCLFFKSQWLWLLFFKLLIIITIACCF